ncbi:MAG TPA: hypothetical protein O0X27_06550 [Methanocorpusculum sp.]|nr:hypothetical protein [Methanocorpusculum sp.]
MTISPADVLLWTNVAVSIHQLDAFGPAAEAKLDADGGHDIAGPSRTQLLAYLVAGYMTTVEQRGGGNQSETLGNYSYTRKSSAGTSVWIDLYQETLKPLIAAAGSSARSGTPLVDRVDVDVLQLNRQFPRLSGRLIR